MRKKLGQYFLRSGKVLREITTAASIPSQTVIVEIGPGKGALTEHILKRYDSVIAVEKDESLSALLQKKFADDCSTGRLTLITGDIRDAMWLQTVGDRSYAVIANIPYYLTGSCIREMVTSTHPPVALALVVQKEVAERITKRKSEKESLLALSVQLFATATYIKTVPRSAFSPQPAVDSAILTITNIQQPQKPVQDRFFAVIKTAFKEKRKTVLKKFNDSPKIQNILKQHGVSVHDRAEDVPFSTWLACADSST